MASPEVPAPPHDPVKAERGRWSQAALLACVLIVGTVATVLAVDVVNEQQEAVVAIEFDHQASALLGRIQELARARVNALEQLTVTDRVVGHALGGALNATLDIKAYDVLLRSHQLAHAEISGVFEELLGSALSLFVAADDDRISVMADVLQRYWNLSETPEPHTNVAGSDISSSTEYVLQVTVAPTTRPMTLGNALHDVSSSADRLEAIDAAVETGHCVAMPASPPPGGSSSLNIPAFCPVYDGVDLVPDDATVEYRREHAVGVVSGIVVTTTLATEPLDQHGGASSHVGMVVASVGDGDRAAPTFDVNAVPAQADVLAAATKRESHDPAEAITAEAAISLLRNAATRSSGLVEYGGRAWRVTIFPLPAFAERFATASADWVFVETLILGVALVALTSTVMGLCAIQQRAAVSESLAQEREQRIAAEVERQTHRTTIGWLAHELRNPLFVSLASGKFLLDALTGKHRGAHRKGSIGSDVSDDLTDTSAVDSAIASGPTSESSGGAADTDAFASSELSSPGPAPGSRDAKLIEDAQAVVDASRQMQRLINDVLDFQALRAGKLSVHPLPTRVRQFLGKLVALHKSVGSKRVALSYTVHHSVPEVIEVDRLRLSQILSNSLTNAFKHTQRGEVSISMRALASQVAVATEPDAALGHAATASGAAPGEHGSTRQRFLVEVADSGDGLPAGIEPEALFSPFATVKPSAAGGQSRTVRDLAAQSTGLGLNISRQLSRLLGGGVSLRNRTDGVRGAVLSLQFEASVPAADAASGSASSAVEPSLTANPVARGGSGTPRRLRSDSSASSVGDGAAELDPVERMRRAVGADGPVRALFVDDEKTNRKLLARIATQIGLVPTTLTDGDEVLAALAGASAGAGSTSTPKFDGTRAPH